jgi:hypothetical protein
MDMLSNIPPSLILAGLVALVALPFVIVGCSVYLADRIVSALRPIFRLLKDQATASQRFATAVPAASATVPAPQPTAATLVSPSTKIEVPAAPPPAQTQAATPAPAPAAGDSSPDAPTEPSHPTEHTEAELEAQRARLRQMIQGH